MALWVNFWKTIPRPTRVVALGAALLCAASSMQAALSVVFWKPPGATRFLPICRVDLESELPVSPAPTEFAMCTADDTDATYVFHDGVWVELAGGVGGGDSFKTIDAPAGTDPVADSATDTLAITASGGLTVTGDSATDTLSFAVGNVATATALAANPTACGGGDFVTDIAADGTLTCATPAAGGLTHPQIMARLAVGGGY